MPAKLTSRVADEITAAGTVSLFAPATQALIIDLDAVTFIDSTVIGALVHLRNLAIGEGKDMKLVNTPPRVRKVLTVTGLDEIFGVTDDVRIDRDAAYLPAVGEMT